MRMKVARKRKCTTWLSPRCRLTAKKVTKMTINSVVTASPKSSTNSWRSKMKTVKAIGTKNLKKKCQRKIKKIVIKIKPRLAITQSTSNLMICRQSWPTPMCFSSRVSSSCLHPVTRSSSPSHATCSKATRMSATNPSNPNLVIRSRAN